MVVPELEPVLVRSRHIGVLCKLYQRHGDDEKLLDAWSKLVDGDWQDPEVQDPLTRIFDLLSDRKDRTLIHRWTAWLVKKDADRALKVRLFESTVDASIKLSVMQLLLSTLPSKRKAEDDRLLLQQIREASPTAGAQLLEHLVVQRRSQVRARHIPVCPIVNETYLCTGPRAALTIGIGVRRPTSVMSRGRVDFEAVASQRYVDLD